jgi:hypothetical protein
VGELTSLEISAARVLLKQMKHPLERSCEVCKTATVAVLPVMFVIIVGMFCT